MAHSSAQEFASSLFCAIFFMHLVLSHAFRPRLRRRASVSLSVGLRHSAESVRVNFGYAPFKCDIDDHVQQRRDTVWASIRCKSLSWRLLDPGRDITGAHASRGGAEGASPTSMEDEERDEAARLVRIEEKASIAR
ncbi:hypothetical protein EDB86DRAFT_2958979 [Lactarius hatsudake]|nr:hypothetical protein EDB86DRAFT_2958979 [Lactarius hatsudake]